MNRRRTIATHRLARQVTELSLAVPQVVTHRVLQMASAGGLRQSSNRREFVLMSTEKVAAFHESWSAMWLQVFSTQMAFAQSLLAASLAPFSPGRRAVGGSNAATAAAARLVAAGLTPIHRKAVANAKRLSRKRR